MTSLENPAAFIDPRTVLRRHGLQPKRRYSQNFLVNAGAVRTIAAAAVDAPEAVVVELGPGLGTLTRALLAEGARVLGIEKDPALQPILDEELRAYGDRFCFREGDAATVLFSDNPFAAQRVCVAGNLPYAITGPILRNLLRQPDHVHKAVFMVQKEVRDRLLAAAATPAYGALSVFVQAGFFVAPLMTLSPGSFFPRPKVSSAVVILTPRKEPVAETDNFRAVVKAAFSMRRKTLRNALSTLGAKEHVDRALSRASVDASRRGESLTVQEFAALAAAFDANTG